MLRMAKWITRNQALQNRAFLADLEQTGNVRETYRRLDIHRGTMTKRRARDPGFAARWDAALAVAHARLAQTMDALATADRPVRLMRTTKGQLQMRRQRPGRLTRAGEQAFLFALSACANVRLAAAAAGFSHSAFYHRAKTCPAFKREMRLALELGYERLEMALLAESCPDSAEYDAWRSNAPPPIPPMTADQALSLLKMHYRTTQLWEEAPYMKRRRGETSEAWSHRRAADYLAERRRQDDQAKVARAAYEAFQGPPSRFEPPPPWLPDLAQLTDWSSSTSRSGTTVPDVRAIDDRLRAAKSGGWDRHED
ncbi:hypothetical protein JW805_12020 [Roseomonas aeriglobus]|nr:hypothetical protein [Roseomonas aeriglobus]